MPYFLLSKKPLPHFFVIQTDNISLLVKNMALFIYKWARRGHDRMVVVFTAICATSAYHH
jgi:hypothetical protein